MKHPELFLLPAFMLADYFLTLLGAIQKDKKYSDHFKTEHYELNPVWQKHVAQRKWFNPRHLLVTVALTVVMLLMMESDEVPELLQQFLLGFLLVMFGVVIGRHLANLLIFRYAIRQPDELSGNVTMSHTMLLSISLYHNLVVLLPLLLIAWFAPSPFASGALFAVVLLAILHMMWISKHRRQVGSSNKPVDATLM